MKLLYAKHSMLERNAIKLLSEAPILLLCRRTYSRRTHYEVLRLKKNCSSDEVRQSFAKLSKMYHPDTSKTGSEEQNARKFQEIMEAYKVLSKKESLDAYDLEISSANSMHYAGPYYATPFGRLCGLQEHRRNSTNGYYRTAGQRDNLYNHWGPARVFNKKNVYVFLIMFVFMNFFVVYTTYMLSKRNRLINDFEGRSSRRILFEMPRHVHYGINARHFENHLNLNHIEDEKSDAESTTNSITSPNSTELTIATVSTSDENVQKD